MPARRDQPARERQPDADPEVPRRPPDPPRQAELEHCDRPSGPDDPRELGEGRGGVVDVPQQVREGEVVERRVGERELVGGSLDERDAVAEALARAGEHLRALVEPGDTESAPEQRLGDEPRAGRDVEDVTAVAREARSTRNRRQRGSWPNESAVPTRSYVGPSGANSARA